MAEYWQFPLPAMVPAEPGWRAQVRHKWRRGDGVETKIVSYPIVAWVMTAERSVVGQGPGGEPQFDEAEDVANLPRGFDAVLVTGDSIQFCSEFSEAFLCYLEPGEDA